MGAATAAPPVAVRLDADGAVVRQDCGPGGCGPAPYMSHEDDNGLLGYSMLGLSRDTIDVVCTEQLMRTIVGRLLDDALGDTPRLSGDVVGEATGCIEWLAERNYFEAQKMALTYSRKYGGGGVVCIIDDGRPCEMEVDINAIRGVSDFVAVPKWYMTPADSGSPRVGRSWYGPRFGRPEHYMVSVPTATPDATMSLAGADHEQRVRSLSGRRFHRSRIIAWPYQDDLDLRQARRFLNWNGWGPGVVEACLAPYLARRDGALRMTDIIRGSHFNVLSMQNVAHAQTTPDGGSGIRNAVAWVKYCLGLTGGGLPFTVIDTASRLEAVSHTLTGLSDVLGEQRRFLLDMLPEYTEVVLFASGGATGMSGDGKSGEWQSYYNNVSSFQRTGLWTAGAFGGGMQQAVRIAMLCKTGPTKGQLDMSVKPVWPPLWTESAKATAETRKLNAEARAMDRANLGMTPHAFLRHDTTLAGAPGSTYPSLDVDEERLPTIAPGGGALEVPAASPGEAAVTPATALGAVAEGNAAPATGDPATPVADASPQMPLFEPVAPTPAEEAASSANVAATMAASLPPDIATEKELAKALAMSTIAFRKWVDTTAVTTYPTPPGTRGGHRYSLGEVLKAWNDAARRRVDSMRQQS